MVDFRRSILFVLGALGALSVTGCATDVRFQARHAPEFNLGTAKTIRVEDFSFAGDAPRHSGLGTVMDDGSLLGFVGGIVGDAVSKPPVKPDSGALQEFHRKGLEAAIEGGGYFHVSHGEDADIRIGGQIEYTFQDSISDFDGCCGIDGKSVKKYRLSRKMTVTVALGLHDRAGKTIGNSKVSNASTDTWEGSSEAEVRGIVARYVDITNLVKVAVSGTHGLVLQKVEPYYADEQRSLKYSWSSNIVKGNNAAAGGKWQDAAQVWNRCLTDRKAVRAAAIHNLAVYDEVQDKLDDALKKYEDVYALTMDPDDAAEIARTEARISEEAVLRQTPTMQQGQ